LVVVVRVAAIDSGHRISEIVKAVRRQDHVVVIRHQRVRVDLDVIEQRYLDDDPEKATIVRFLDEDVGPVDPALKDVVTQTGNMDSGAPRHLAVRQMEQDSFSRVARGNPRFCAVRLRFLLFATVQTRQKTPSDGAER
jgi:hypothetical protein